MELELKITCLCHQAKIAKCCQTPLVAPIAPKICSGEFFNMLNPSLPSDLLSDHYWNTSFDKKKALRNCFLFGVVSMTTYEISKLQPQHVLFADGW